MTPNELKTWVEIVQGTITTVGILAAGIWSFFTFVVGRSFAPNMQIQFDLKRIVHVADREYAIVTIKIKNIGRTRVRKKRCCLETAWVDLGDPGARMRTLSRLDRPLDPATDRLYDILESHTSLEPDEEETEDVYLALGDLSAFKVGVTFTSKSNKTWKSSVIWDVRAGGE